MMGQLLFSMQKPTHTGPDRCWLRRCNPSSGCCCRSTAFFTAGVDGHGHLFAGRHCKSMQRHFSRRPAVHRSTGAG